MEELQARHRRELRDLQSVITQKKKAASKKNRKGVNDECDTLQRDLQGRQQAELATLGQNVIVDYVQALSIDDNGSESHKSTSLGNTDHGDLGADAQGSASLTSISKGAPTVDGRSKKPNRQKARLARRAAEQQAEAAQAAEEAANLPNLREQELKAMEEHLDQLGLTEITIRPDGHCMYSAVAMQLTDEQLQAPQSESSTSLKPYQLVRNTTGNFISNHPADFASFLDEPLDVYVSKIKDTAEWGGQLELQAVARAYDVDINVLQGDGRVEKIESGSGSPRDLIWLAYYRHSYGLGEHYNALRKLP